MVAPQERASDSANRNRVSSANLACASTAVQARESALISAWSKFSTSVTTVLTNRKSALLTAWSLTDTNARRKAIKDAWTTSRKDHKNATIAYKADQKSAWSAFNTASVACGGEASKERTSNSSSSVKIEI